MCNWGKVNTDWLCDDVEELQLLLFGAVMILY